MNVTTQIGRIISLNVSEKKGQIKIPTERVVIDKRGIKNDAHAGFHHRQISILSYDYD